MGIQASSGQLWPVSALAPTPESTEGPVSTSLALVSTICQVTYISDFAEVKGGMGRILKTSMEEL